MKASYDFDVIVVGSGPGGCSAAIEAAKLGKRVALVERKERLGGVWIHAGTITSKVLRNAIVNVRAGGRVVGLDASGLAAVCSMSDLVRQVDTVVAQEAQAISWKLARSGVTLYSGKGAFLDPHTLVVSSDFDSKELSAEFFVLATGSSPTRPPHVPFDRTSVLDAAEILCVKKLPASLIIVGAGIIGTEYANMFAALGVETTLIDRHPALLDFVDRELIEQLTQSMRSLGVKFRLGETVESVRKEPGRVIARLADGKEAAAACLLFCVGRTGNTQGLNLGAAHVDVDDKGLILHDEYFRTRAPHVYAVGDVVGFPALASTAMMQGRVAAEHLAGTEIRVRRQQIPYALFTIPEMSMIGLTEEELTKIGQPYRVGRARYYDTVTGQVLQDSHGMLKVLFRPDTKELLGIHSIGSSSAEIIHIGQAVMELGGTLEYFRDVVFNLPTLAESYRHAALDGLRRLSPEP